MLYKKDVKVDNINDSRSIIFSMITPDSVVLDMGCACGDLAEQLVKIKNCKIYGLEYNPESVEKSRSLGVFEEVNQFDLNKLSSSSFAKYIGKFDYVVLGDILEHLLSPSQVLTISKTYLKPEGRFVISLPNLSHASIKANLLLNDFTRTPLGILDSTHLHFFTYKNIASILYENKLNIKNVTYTTLPFAGYQPHKITELPNDIVSFIINDKHSAVFQYILECYVDDKVHFDTLLDTMNNLQVTSCNENMIFKLKRYIMTKCPYIIKYLEKIR